MPADWIVLNRRLRRRVPEAIFKAMRNLYAAAVLFCTVSGSSAETCPDAPADFAEVADVGADLTLSLTDGRVVALTGIEAPRATAAWPRRPQDLRAKLQRDLAATTIGLAPLGGRDRWGAIPAIVFTDAGTLADTLLADGDVRMRLDPLARACRDSMLAAEARGRGAGAGVWSDPALQIIDAAAAMPADIETTGLTIVEGAVASVGETATRLYLNLGKARGGFAISIPKRDIALMRSETILAARVAGTRLRVRGLMDRGTGLRIDISDADAIEILGTEAMSGAR